MYSAVLCEVKDPESAIDLSSKMQLCKTEKAGRVVE